MGTFLIVFPIILSYFLFATGCWGMLYAHARARAHTHTDVHTQTHRDKDCAKLTINPVCF